jgi:hypothetical protein
MLSTWEHALSTFTNTECPPNLNLPTFTHKINDDQRLSKISRYPTGFALIKGVQYLPRYKRWAVIVVKDGKKKTLYYGTDYDEAVKTRRIYDDSRTFAS